MIKVAIIYYLNATLLFLFLIFLFFATTFQLNLWVFRSSGLISDINSSADVSIYIGMTESLILSILTMKRLNRWDRIRNGKYSLALNLIAFLFLALGLVTLISILLVH